MITNQNNKKISEITGRDVLPRHKDHTWLAAAQYNSQTGTYELDNFIFQKNINSFTTFRLTSDFISRTSDNKDLNSNINIYYYIRRSESMISLNKVV